MDRRRILHRRRIVGDKVFTQFSVCCKRCGSEKVEVRPQYYAKLVLYCLACGAEEEIFEYGE